MTEASVSIARAQKANRRLKMFEDAHDAYLFRGANDPADREATEARYWAARGVLRKMLTGEVPL